jgi:ribosomal protein S18 acetylase RimI-like enzyme
LPRLKPAPGYITAKDAIAMLDISDATLSTYVKKGWLKRYGPLGRQHKFYKLSEIEALVESRNTFDEYQEMLPAFFGVAAPEDMSTIVALDKRIFHVDITEETYLRWMKKNPETFFVLRGSSDTVVGYVCLLPLKKEIMDRFVRDEIDMDDISPDDVALFEPGRPLHLYVIALCVDPAYRSAIKHAYGARLVRGLFTFLLELARKGIEVETITARTYKADGIRLLRKMGIPQLRSPVIGKHLFSVCVADSGFPILVRYSDLLSDWKQK